MTSLPPQEIRLAYVVPTKDRPDDLRKLLISLAKQTVMPAQIVIVDGSDPDIAWVCNDFPELPLSYVREFPPSLARQRNAGMAALEDDIEVAGYLDDDLELAEEATERMLTFWESAGSQVGGAAFSIVNQPLPHPVFGWLSRLFLLNGPQQGKLLRSGFPTSITPRSETLPTQWLYGGATLWRRNVIRKFSYDEWYVGHGFLEDVDYSHRVSRAYELRVVADARCWHWPKPIVASRNVSLGRQQVVNRIYFVRKLGGFSVAALTWALFGQCVRNVLESLKDGSSAGLYRVWGNLLGLADIARGRTGSVEGIWK
ncbi:MAG: glycosyltransferase family 2 protein [Kiloniellales bacterium]